MFHVAYGLACLVKSVIFDGDEHHGETTGFNNNISKEDIELKNTMATVYNNLFKEQKCINTDFVIHLLGTKWPLHQILSVPDVDNYNLLDKAVIYNDVEFAEVLIQEFKKPTREYPLDSVCFKDTIHLASFLGCTQIIQLFMDSDSDVIQLQGAVKLAVVIGPPGHKLSSLMMGTINSSQTPQYRIDWTKKNHKIEPIFFAVCNDNLETLRLFLCDDSVELRLEDDRNFASQLVGVASANASYECLTLLLSRNKYGVKIRDIQNRLAVSQGLCHGVNFINFLVRFGADESVFNEIDTESAANALHVYYLGLSLEDIVYTKYHQVYKVTQLLIQYGADVNKVAYGLVEEDLQMPVTPLHILMKNVAMIIGHGKQCSKTSASEWDKLQNTFDIAMLKSFKLAIESGYETQKHAGDLLLLLFSNKNYLKRYKLYSKLKNMNGLKFQGFGLGIIVRMAKAICEEVRQVSYKRRTMTPLLAFLDGYANDLASLPMLNHGDISDLMIGCIQLLLDYGVDPNIYPLTTLNDSSWAPPLIHFIDLTLKHHSNYPQREQAIFTNEGLRNFLKVVNLLCQYNAKFTCYMSVSGAYVKHGIFDVILPFVFSAAAVTQSSLNTTVFLTDLGCTYTEYVGDLSHKLITMLLLWGAEPKVYDFVYVLTRLQGLSQVKQELLFQMLVFLSIHLDLSSITHFDLLLQVLFNKSEQNIASSCLNNAFAYVSDLRFHNGPNSTNTETSESDRSTVGNNTSFHLDPFLTFWSKATLYCAESQSLKATCRRQIHKSMENNYVIRVSKLPLPKSLIKFLSNFD